MTHHPTVLLSNSIYSEPGMVKKFRSQSNDSFIQTLKMPLVKVMKK